MGLGLLSQIRWVADSTIGYSRTSSGNGIDFSPVRMPTEAGADLTAPIESKWVDDGSRREALVLEGRYGRAVMATTSIPSRVRTPYRETFSTSAGPSPGGF